MPATSRDASGTQQRRAAPQVLQCKRGGSDFHILVLTSCFLLSFSVFARCHVILVSQPATELQHNSCGHVDVSFCHLTGCVHNDKHCHPKHLADSHVDSGFTGTLMNLHHRHMLAAATLVQCAQQQSFQDSQVPVNAQRRTQNSVLPSLTLVSTYATCTLNHVLFV